MERKGFQVAMTHSLLTWMTEYWLWNALISIGLNILIAITGILPSAFITVGTIGFFGLQTGLFILIIGEAAGAIVSFLLYRKGMQQLSTKPKIQHFNNKFLGKLQHTNGVPAFCMVLLLRILPFIPSGAVTLTAALSDMRLLAFSVASTLGKIPALLIEAYSIDRVLKLSFQWQLGMILIVIMFYLLYLFWKRKKDNLLTQKKKKHDLSP